MNKLWMFLLAFLLLPCVLAVVSFPFSASSVYFFTIYYFPIIIAIEALGFWLSANKLFDIKVSFWMSLLIVAVANIVTSFIGMFIFGWVLIPSNTLFYVLISLFVMYLLTALIGFGIYLLFFIKNKKIKKLNLLWISLIVNLLNYLFLFLVYAF
jgi:hypothetical protein